MDRLPRRAAGESGINTEKRLLAPDRLPLLALGLVALASAYPQYPEVPPTPLAAACDLKAATGSTVGGQVMLVQDQPDGQVRVSGLVHGLTAGHHGFHMHQNGDLADDCKAAGPHFNPHKTKHGAPHDGDAEKHAGDFGNIVASEQGVASVDFYTAQISLAAKSVVGVIGRAIVVHALPDDLGRGNTSDSVATGSAGARLACCIVTEACSSSRC